MTGFIEPRPDLVTPNPGGYNDPLGESVLDPNADWLRVFEPRDVRIVIGRHQDPIREVLCERAVADRIPVHRRIAGGGAVVLSPGMLVVAVRLVRDHVGTASYLDRVNTVLVAGIASCCPVRPLAFGLGDLALPMPEGPRKILGASLRQTGRMVVYLGCILVADASALMARYLATPSREPEYRHGRDHGRFCGALATHGVNVSQLEHAITTSCRLHLAIHAGI